MFVLLLMLKRKNDTFHVLTCGIALEYHISYIRLHVKFVYWAIGILVKPKEVIAAVLSQQILLLSQAKFQRDGFEPYHLILAYPREYHNACFFMDVISLIGN